MSTINVVISSKAAALRAKRRGLQLKSCRRPVPFDSELVVASVRRALKSSHAIVCKAPWEQAGAAKAARLPFWGIGPQQLRGARRTTKRRRK